MPTFSPFIQNYMARPQVERRLVNNFTSKIDKSARFLPATCEVILLKIDEVRFLLALLLWKVRAGQEEEGQVELGDRHHLSWAADAIDMGEYEGRIL
ncbi:unnamed protein product [Calypogeia fissa]